MTAHSAALPEVSVVIPAYNRLPFLREAINSVLRQSFAQWELIIADDGSDDVTRSYLGTLRDPRIVVLLLDHRGAPSIARNVAIRSARAKYVAFLDSDDLWLETKLETQLRIMRSRADRRWSYTAFLRVDAFDKVLPEEARRRWIPYEGEIFEAVVTTQASIRTSCVMVERELLNRLEGFDEQFATAEDYELWMRLAMQSGASVVDVPLTRKRSHDENHSRAVVSALIAHGRSLEKIAGLVGNDRAALLRRERLRNAVSTFRVLVEHSQFMAATVLLLKQFKTSWRHRELWTQVARSMTPRGLRLRGFR